MFELGVAPGVTFFEGERRGRFPFGNVLLLEGRDARLLVDTGAGDEVLEAVLGRGPVHIVFNTHYHIDHVRGNARFRGAVFWCPEGEAGAFSSEEEFFQLSGWDLVGTETARSVLSGLGWRPTPVARELADGEVLDLGGLSAAVVRLPGHTPGHSGLVLEDKGILFTADIDFSRFGPWYGDVHSSVDDYLASVRRLTALAAAGPGFETVLTSHRRPLTREAFAAGLAAFKDHFELREEKVLSVLAAEGPLTLTELTARWPIYGPRSELHPGLYKAEFFMLQHHLDRLARAGKVERVPGAAGSATDGAGPESVPGAAERGSAPEAAGPGSDRVDSYGGGDLWRKR